MTSRSSSLSRGNLAAVAVATMASTVAAQFEERGKRHLPALLASSPGAQVVAAADVDADGDQDLLFGTAGPNRVDLNRGHGGFDDASATHLPAVAEPTRALAFFDMDGDGDLDLVEVNDARPERLYENDGSGRFAAVPAQSVIQLFGRGRAVAVGDFDGDGDPDFAVANDGDPDYVYLNGGGGVFGGAPAGTLPPRTAQSLAVAAGDFDGDGSVDLFFGQEGGDRLLHNDGTGRFTARASTALPVFADNSRLAAAEDLDADGDLDLVLSNGLVRNDGGGVFSAFSGSPGVGATAAVGDVDRDGDLDVTASGYGSSVLLRNDGLGGFAREPNAFPAGYGSVAHWVLVDVDRDGAPDLAAAGIGEDLLFNGGSGRFEDSRRADLPAAGVRTSLFEQHTLALADVDGDGDPDMLAGFVQKLSIFDNDGTGSFHADRQDLPARRPLSPTAAVFADIEGDGDLDVFVGYGGGDGQNQLLVNDGTGVFADETATRYPGPRQITTALAAGDVDGDGDVDLVVANDLFSGGAGGGDPLLLNDGAGVFAPATPGAYPPDTDHTQDVALCDVDGDGDLDILEANGANRLPELDRLHLGDGSGRFSLATGRLPLTPDITRSIAVGDVDGDGDLDLVKVLWGFPGTNVVLLENDGSGTFLDVTASALPVVTAALVQVRLADVDDDGDLDVFLAGDGGARHRLLRNDGRGGFTAATAAARLGALEIRAQETALCDGDGDGDLDLFAIGVDARMLAARNLLRQLDAPLQARLGGDYALELTASAGRFPQNALVWLGTAELASGLPVATWGQFRLDPRSVVAFPAPFGLGAPGAVAAYRTAIPADPVFAGVALRFQALFTHEISPLGWRFSGLVRDGLR